MKWDFGFLSEVVVVAKLAQILKHLSSAKYNLGHLKGNSWLTISSYSCYFGSLLYINTLFKTFTAFSCCSARTQISINWSSNTFPHKTYWQPWRQVLVSVRSKDVKLFDWGIRNNDWSWANWYKNSRSYHHQRWDLRLVARDLDSDTGPHSALLIISTPALAHPHPRPHSAPAQCFTTQLFQLLQQ